MRAKQKQGIGSVVAVGLAFTMWMAPTQGQTKARYNKAIGLLEQGKVACGVSGGPAYGPAQQIGGNPDVDFVFYDMEHSPYDVANLRIFMQFLLNPRVIVKNKGQNNIATLVRIPAYGREMNQWMVKQVLDAGAMGIIVPHLETADQALNLVRAGRYPQPYGAEDFEPQGLRGWGGAGSARLWGASSESPAQSQEYLAKADSWPLDPNGEILLIAMIENQLGAANAREIARVPGISGLAAVAFFGDQSVSYRQNEEEIEKHIQTILADAKEFNKIPVCITCTKNGTQEEAEARINEGWQLLTVPGCAEARRKLGRD